jgi:hypothetical protein
MGNIGKRLAVEEFIATGEMTGQEAMAESAAPDDAPVDGPLDPAWLEDIRERRARLRASPETELPIYREFYKNPALTQAQMDELLATMELAVGSPEAFYDGIQQESIFSDIGGGLACAVKIPRFFPTRNVSPEQRGKLRELGQVYPVTAGIDINPNDHHFEMCDPAWWPLLRAKVEESVKFWPKGLGKYLEHDATRTFVYEGKAGTRKVALMSDFGVGQYHSYCIAKQLTNQAYPYVFHLGDVYYGGSTREFAERYEKPLDPVMNKSKLFGLPENHELYAHGEPYQAFLKKERTRGRIEQEGSYFCVRFPKHQIVGIDVNWNGRQRFQHAKSRAWLEQVLQDGGDRTTILLSGSAPFAYGNGKPTGLHKDLEKWIEAGRLMMWFWGDEHYCALFEREPSRAPFIASCIGHGGYPGDRQSRTPARDAASYVKPTWVEDAPRFPNGLRDDLTNNGWVELTMLDEGGVELLYVDWLGAKRFFAKYRLDRGSNANLHTRSLQLVDKKAFGRTDLL